MFSLQKNLKFITINQDYLKYLHDFCNEVYYKPAGYETKPYMGILIQENNAEYVIPLSSAKQKHKTWKNIDIDRFLVFENCSTIENDENHSFLLRFQVARRKMQRIRTSSLKFYCVMRASPIAIPAAR